MFQGKDGMTKTHVSAELLAALGELLAAVQAISLDYATDDAEQARATRDEVADQLSDYVLPRLVQLDAPLLTVVGGSTGAGKSTLVNSIVGAPVTEAGVLRPTTRSPVLVHHPDDVEWFSRDRILPDLPRLGDPDAPDGYGLRLVTTTSIPSGLALLDAPDVDSVDQINRELATQLLAAADLWLFVTSAARYADQVPWSYLKRAAERSTSLAVVLDRTAPEAVEEVRGHLARMMTARGLADSPLFTVPEGALTYTGLLKPEAVAPISGWLRDLAANPADRRHVIGRTLDGAVRHLVFRAHDVADAVESQLEIARSLADPTASIFDAAEENLQRRLVDGSLVGGEVESRWTTLVSDGLERIVDVEGGGRTSALPGSFVLVESVASAIKSLVVSQIDRAVHDATERWASSAHGRSILHRSPGADRISADIRAATDEFGDAWAVDLVERIAAADDAGVDPNALVACAAMATLVAGSSTTASNHLSRRVLDQAVGVDAARSLVDHSVSTLRGGAHDLLEAERRRLMRLAPGVDTILAQQDALRDAARAAEYARHTDFINGEIAP